MKKLLFMLMLLCSVVTYGHDTTIVIRNQQEFDRMDDAIREATGAGKKEILVKMRCGSYSFHDDHLQLKGLPADVSVTIKGSGKVKIYAAGKSIERLGAMRPDAVYYKKNRRKIVDGWSEVQQCHHLIEVVDSAAKLCRLKLADESEQVQAGDYVQISQWFYTRKYVVTESRNGYVYFTERYLERCAGGKAWTINYDYIYGKEMPRYRIWHTTNEKYNVTEGSAMRFLWLQNSNLKSLKLEGITFCGNGYHSTGGLIQLDNVKNGVILINNCIFEHCHSFCVSLGSAYNVNISHCRFYDNQTTGIYSGGRCKNVHVTDCLFENNSCGWNNTFCINIKGKDFLIARNTFRDFAYGAIGIGEHYGDKKVWVSGTIEDNEICYTPHYYANYRKHTLMDSGAIYLWTQNDNVIIRNNNIHDYIGMKDNRGIFCDDGASNFMIIGNKIIGIANCYSIDSRRIKDQQPDKFTNNVNITITDNIVDGSIRFEGRDDTENHCVYGRNIVRASSRGVSLEVKVEKVSFVE